MSDRLTPQQRSANMSRIRGKNTSPEKALRAALYRNGIRYRIHDRRIVGRPDIVHSPSRTAVFVDGCFWHGCPKHYVAPVNRAPFWKAKLHSNQQRRDLVRKTLQEAGWLVFECWECDVDRQPEVLASQIANLIRGRLRT